MCLHLAACDSSAARAVCLRSAREHTFGEDAKLKCIYRSRDMLHVVIQASDSARERVSTPPPWLVRQSYPDTASAAAAAAAPGAQLPTWEATSGLPAAFAPFPWAAAPFAATTACLGSAFLHTDASSAAPPGKPAIILQFLLHKLLNTPVIKKSICLLFVC